MKINEAFLEKKKHVLAAFVDIQSAFDNVNIDKLLAKLAKIGCSKRVLQFINFISRERHIYTEHDTNILRYLHTGVPQGGVLLPLLYSIYVAEITKGVNKSVNASQFADDTGLYIKCKCPKRG